MNRFWIALIAVLAVTAAVLVYVDKRAVSPAESPSGGVNTVKIALLAQPAADSDPSRMQGCDLVVYKTVTVPTTTAPLTAALNALFARQESWPYTETAPGNFITSQKNLSFERAAVSSGTADIYLTGNYSLAGECDDPRLSIVLTNTAMQFPTVQSVKIFLNGSPLSIPPLSGK